MPGSHQQGDLLEATKRAVAVRLRPLTQLQRHCVDSRDCCVCHNVYIYKGLSHSQRAQINHTAERSTVPLPVIQMTGQCLTIVYFTSPTDSGPPPSGDQWRLWHTVGRGWCPPSACPAVAPSELSSRQREAR